MLIALAILFCVVDHNFAADLRCYNGSVAYFTQVPLNLPDKLITGSPPCIDIQKEVIFIVNGYDNDPDNDEVVKAVISAYTSAGTYNVILLYWPRESKGDTVNLDLSYQIAITNSKIISKQLASATVRLVELGMSKNIHYVGHSLGANLVGEAGRYAIKQNLTIPWITALDPARPGFESQAQYPPVDTSCAEFVDVLHCDPGGYGLNKSIGHIDIYLNYGLYLDGTRLQPGCSRGLSETEIEIGGNSCSHTRCMQYHYVSVSIPRLFKVGQARNYHEWVEKNGHFYNTTYMGPDIDQHQRGNYYCSTSDTEPWGKKEAGLVP